MVYSDGFHCFLHGIHAPQKLAGTVTNYPRDHKDHSLALEDIVLESDLLDIEKIKSSITFEQFLR